MRLEEIKAYCIHLPKRIDREGNMYKELNYFVPNQYTIIDGEEHPIGKIGVSRSFKKVITEAKKLKLPYVLIFEDDVKFTSDKSREGFQKALDNLPPNWDILLGGIYADNNLYDFNYYIKRVDLFSALHCVLIRDTMYDKILEHKEDMYKTIDLDLYISRLPNVNKFLVYPMIAIQYIGESDTVNKTVNYSNLLEKYDILD